MTEDSTILIRRRPTTTNAPTRSKLGDWHKSHVLPVDALMDLAIGLAMIFGVLQLQGTKSHMVINFRDAFDSVILPESEVVVSRVDFLLTVAEVYQDLTIFAENFPGQAPMALDLITSSVLYLDESVDIFQGEPPNVTLDVVRSLSAIVIEASFLYGDDVSILYTVSFDRMRPSGGFEISSTFSAHVSDAGSSGLGLPSFMWVTLVLASVGFLMSGGRLGSAIIRARTFARQNYVSFLPALREDPSVDLSVLRLGATVLGCALFLAFCGPDLGERRWPYIVMAAGGFIHFVGVFGHLEMKAELSFVTRLIRLSLGQMVIFFSGFLPFFTAWLIAGLAFFGHFSPLFHGILRSIEVMWAMAHTDVCMDVQQELRDSAAVSNWLIWVWAVTWLFQTGGMVLNSMIAIAEHNLDVLLQEDRRAQLRIEE